MLAKIAGLGALGSIRRDYLVVQNFGFSWCPILYRLLPGRESSTDMTLSGYGVYQEFTSRLTVKALSMSINNAEGAYVIQV